MRTFDAQPVWDMTDVFDENEEEAVIRHNVFLFDSQVRSYLRKVDLFHKFLRFHSDLHHDAKGIGYAWGGTHEQ